MLRTLGLINQFKVDYRIAHSLSLITSRPYDHTPFRKVQKSPVLKHIRTSHSSRYSLEFKIREHNDVGETDEYADNETNVELDDLELMVGDDKLTLNLTWLRDSCHCHKCTHQYSRQRLFTFKNFKRDLFSIIDVKLITQLDALQQSSLGPIAEEFNEGYLGVKWADGHDSIYSLNWLIRLQRLYNEPYLKQYLQERTLDYPRDGFYAPLKKNDQAPKLWDVATIKSKLEAINYSDLIDGFKFNHNSTFINANNLERMTARRFDAIYSLSDQLIKYGLAFIENVPVEQDQVLNITRSLAYERPTGYGAVFNVTIEPSKDINLAYSSLEFDLHSDLTYREKSPGVQLLHCIKNSNEGGLSYFADSFYAAKILRETHPHLYNVLRQFPITFAVRDPYRDVVFRSQQPVITQDVQGNIKEVYYSPFSLPPLGFIDDIKLFYLAIDRFTRILQSKENKLVAKLDPGEMFIFQNRRVLHGRSSYDATTSERFLQGCYMDWDEITCLREKLHDYKVSKSKL